MTEDLLYTVGFRVHYFTIGHQRSIRARLRRYWNWQILLEGIDVHGWQVHTQTAFLLTAGRDFPTYAGTNARKQNFSVRNTVQCLCPVELPVLWLYNLVRCFPIILAAGLGRKDISSPPPHTITYMPTPTWLLLHHASFLPLPLLHNISVRALPQSHAHYYGMTALRMLPMEHQPQGLVEQSHTRVTITE